MTSSPEIRQSVPGDIDAILELYPQAFPDEDLLPVVTRLLEDASIRMSLVATIDNLLIGNVIFTTCSVDGNDVTVALLAPLAVAPHCQRQGIGTALVRDGMQRLRQAGVGVVCVLGDPAYYGRLGFVTEKDIETPYPLPAIWADAWQSQRLGDVPTCAGQLLVPAPWQDVELWSD